MVYGAVIGGVQAADVSTAVQQAGQVAATSVATATQAHVELSASTTRFRLEVDRAVAVRTYTMAHPYRLVIDAANLAFRLPPRSGHTGNGLVARYRFGLFAPGRSRIVLDLTGPVRIDKAEMQVHRGDPRATLVIEFSSITPDAYAAANPPPAQAAAPDPLRTQSIAASPEAPAPATSDVALRVGRFDPAAPPAVAPGRRPVIVIDPGHGGLDPGTVGSRGVLEKNVVLAVARRLRGILVATGHYDVTMTRSNDAFVALDDRVAVAERLDADLFISLHADAVENKAAAGSIRGATVYMLSPRASDEQARRLAERENAADQLAGIDAIGAQASEDVRGILFDLMRRETADLSATARAAVVEELRARIALSRTPARAAAFRVLRQSRSPAVLVELGYMTHSADQALMTTPEWQSKVATALASAVKRFFEAPRWSAR